MSGSGLASSACMLPTGFWSRNTPWSESESSGASLISRPVVALGRVTPFAITSNSGEVEKVWSRKITRRLNMSTIEVSVRPTTTMRFRAFDLCARATKCRWKVFGANPWVPICMFSFLSNSACSGRYDAEIHDLMLTKDVHDRYQVAVRDAQLRRDERRRDPRSILRFRPAREPGIEPLHQLSDRSSRQRLLLDHLVASLKDQLE